MITSTTPVSAEDDYFNNAGISRRLLLHQRWYQQ
jgi:hypothetical protein